MVFGKSGLDPVCTLPTALDTSIFLDKYGLLALVPHASKKPSRVRGPVNFPNLYVGLRADMTPAEDGGGLNHPELHGNDCGYVAILVQV